MLKLAWRNITSRIGRSAAIVLAVAIAVAMIFAMLSFKPTVRSYIYSTETSVSGASEVRISAKSNSDSRITEVATPLEAVDGVAEVVPSLVLYALIGDEYVQLRGFETNSLCKLQNIDVVCGSVDEINEASPTSGHSDGIVISEAAAKRFSLSIGDPVTVICDDGSPVKFYIGAIAEKNGYFLEDSPYQFIGNIYGVSRLLSATGHIEMSICNEIYVKLKDGADIDKVIRDIGAIPAYSTMLVAKTADEKYVDEQTSSLTAPVVLAGAAVLFLSIAMIFLLFMMGERDKLAYISKLATVGATRRQIFTTLTYESLILALAGAFVGTGLAVGIFTAIVRGALSTYMTPVISAWRLILAALLGSVSAMTSSFVPILKSMKRSIRENLLDARKKRKLIYVVAPVALAFAALFIALTECGALSVFATAVLSAISVAVLLVTLGCILPAAIFGTASLVSKARSPICKVAALGALRQRRHARSAVTLGVGMAVAMMLFMAWSLTTNIFDSYISSFKNMAFVTNIQSNIDADVFKELNGVSNAAKIIWQSGSLKGENFDKSIELLGSKYADELVDFRYITPKDTVKAALLNDEPYIFVDQSLVKLYSVDVGDELELTLDGVTRNIRVGGILRHELFNGAYVVVSENVIYDLFGISPNTVVVTAEGNIDAAVDAIRDKFADNNYYVASALTVYRWEAESTTAVFDLVGTLAFCVALFIIAVAVASSLVGRSSEKNSFIAILNAGMSKNSLLVSEIVEYALVAVVCFALAFVFSLAVTAGLIRALALFGLYFEFMYDAGTVAAVGAAIAACYVLTPLVFGFKKRYTVKKA